MGCEEMTGAGGAELGEPSLALVGLPSTARVFILNSSSPKSHSKFLPSEMIEATVVFICQLFCPLLSRVNPRVSLCLLESTTLSQPPFCTDEPRSERGAYSWLTCYVTGSLKAETRARGGQQGARAWGPGKGTMKGEERVRGGAPPPSFALRCFLLNLQSDSPSLIESGVPGLPDSSRAHADGNSFCGLLPCPVLMGPGVWLGHPASWQSRDPEFLTEAASPDPATK